VVVHWCGPAGGAELGFQQLCTGFGGFLRVRARAEREKKYSEPAWLDGSSADPCDPLSLPYSLGRSKQSGDRWK
jgi:hypothetical protein